MKKILIIDDEEGMCWALEKSLSQDGFEVLTTTNGNDGLTIFNNHPVELILLDIKLKESNGLLILEQIRKTNTKVPILVMTGYSSMSMALEAMAKGATGYLTKPVKVSNLRETVKELLLGEPAENVQIVSWNNRHD